MPTAPASDRAPATDDARQAAVAQARAAGLRYSTDARPGISRRRAGKGFSYRDPDGSVVRDREVVDRLRRLAIPPAWTDVWICPWPNGHLQATGRDARGRKQYRYHPDWRSHRDTDKFERMLAFAAALPRIRAQCERDLARRGLPREKVLAAVVRLLELTLIRVGNDAYARLNRSFGLTTLRGRHARVDGSSVRFRFRGKSSRVHEVDLRDRRLANLIARCQELPGQDLFQYVDADGEAQDIASEDVNDYIREAGDGPFTAKDFRTWAGTVLAYRALRAMQADTPAKGDVVDAIRTTADHLGNTPAVTRGSYVHPAVLEAYLEGSIPRALVEAAEDDDAPLAAATRAEERAVMRLLRRQQTARSAARASSTSRSSGRERRRRSDR